MPKPSGQKGSAMDTRAHQPPSIGNLPRARRRRSQMWRLLFAALAIAALVNPFVYSPAAAAEPCPDVQVVFARGTFEPPGVGVTGQAFVDALRADLPNKSVDVYAVNYPASLDFARAADGVADARNKVQDVANKCPKTKMVLSGYSQGAAVMAYITTDNVPPNFELPAGITGPMPKSIAGHVAAVTLFGKPSTGFLNMLDTNAPPITIGREYGGKALDLCADNDPVCSVGGGGDPAAHGMYAVNGMTQQAAGFASQHVSSSLT
ncbi:MAG: cutinase [Mycobacterium sp.]|nr:cutinase [Mycobacterium sp.]